LGFHFGSFELFPLDLNLLGLLLQYDFSYSIDACTTSGDAAAFFARFSFLFRLGVPCQVIEEGVGPLTSMMLPPFL
jgi:hypothetical protein